jgi:prepilin signal peptidase PulO-like enzyme (type II secretory pathway)
MAIVMGFLGLLVGGLTNQLAADLPARRGLTAPHCPYCGETRPWGMWLSLPAYLARRVRCPSCDASIKPIRPITELGLAAGYAYLWITLGPSIKLVFQMAYLAVLALILVTDIERRLILNVVTYPAILFAIAAGFFTPGMRGWSALAGGAIGFLFFLVAALVGTALFGSGALGGGDVKLAAFVGLITGFPLVIGALLLTIVTGAVVSLFLLVTGMRSLRDPIPYGPFLVIGGVVALLWGYQIVAWLIY